MKSWQIRLLVTSALMLATAAYLAITMRAEPALIRQPLATCPMEISDWSGARAADLDERTLSVLGADEYINRTYKTASGVPVGLFVAYYGSQRQGDTMHSPLNCLPGAGWSPVSFKRIDVPAVPGAAGGPAIHMNRYVIEKGLNKQLVLYWYQSHGRTIASEYLGKFYLVLDAIRTNRTDGALVRVIAPLTVSEAEAERQAIGFSQSLYPLLTRYFPD